MTVDPARFEAAVAGAADILDSPHQVYDDALFVRYTARIIELMGGAGPELERVAREIYDDWAEHSHFELYPDVRETLRELKAMGFRLGLISNSHRPLEIFDAYFDLNGLISVRVSSSAHGYLKPHPSIFRSALELMQVAPDAAVMVGDSLGHDVIGARGVGMHSILLARSGAPAVPPAHDVPVITSLVELPAMLEHKSEPRGFSPGDRKR